MTWARVKDWAMCGLFWGCLFLVADRFMAKGVCGVDGPILERLLAYLWRH
jgi:hypothetical protein